MYDASQFNLITKINCDSVNSVSWSLGPDGLYLTTGHDDRSVRCWRLAYRDHEAYLQLRWCQGVQLALTLEGAQLAGAEGLSPMNAALLKQRGAVGEPAPARSSGPQESEARAVVQQPAEESRPGPVDQTNTTERAVSSGSSAEPEPGSLPSEMPPAAEPRPLTWLAEGAKGKSLLIRSTKDPVAQAVNTELPYSVVPPCVFS